MSEHFEDKKEPLEDFFGPDAAPQDDPLQGQLDFPTGELPQPRQRLTPAQRAETQRAKRADERAAKSSKRAQAKSSEGKAKRSRPSILNYLALLFAVAFLLLLMAYFQQQRQNAETADALQKSASAVQSVQNVMEENEALRARVAQLEEAEQRAQSLEVDNKLLSGQVETLGKQIADQGRATDLFWQIDEAYAQKKYRLCRTLIQTMESEVNADGNPLKESLSRTSTTENGRFSPYDRYNEIYNALY